MRTTPICPTCLNRPSEVGLSVCPACGARAAKCDLCHAPLHADGSCTLCQPPVYNRVPPYRAPFDAQLVMLADGLVEIRNAPLEPRVKALLLNLNATYAGELAFAVKAIEKAEGRR